MAKEERRIAPVLQGLNDTSVKKNSLGTVLMIRLVCEADIQHHKICSK